VLGLTLDPMLQALAQRLADCYTGRLAGADCAAVWPADAAWRERHFQRPGSLRAAALGLALVEVESGRVTALAGSVSDCTLEHMARRAEPDARGRTAALRPQQACAQLPDRRSAWLALQHPALWLLPPGSALKGLSVVAGIDAGLVPASEDVRWKRILAESELRLPVQGLALAAGAHFLDVLDRAGWNQPEADLLWGAADAARVPRGVWPPTLAARACGRRPCRWQRPSASGRRRRPA
jgi:hypothetical protein